MSNEELANSIYTSMLNNDKSSQNKLLSQLYQQCYNLIYKYAISFHKLNFERCLRLGIEPQELVNESYFIISRTVKDFCEKQTKYKFTTFLTWHLKNVFYSMAGYRSTKSEPLNNAISLDTPISDTEDHILGDTIADPNATTTENTDLQLTIAGVFPAIRGILHDDTAGYDVLLEKYKYKKTIDEIATSKHITYNQVREYERKAIYTLKTRGKRIIDEYIDALICTTYHNSGLKNFRITFTSSVEWAVIKADQYEKRYFEQ